MSQTRYERLSNSQDDNQSRFATHYNDDDDNEEIELGREHRLRFQDLDENDTELDNCYVNGHAGAGNPNSPHQEAGLKSSMATTAHPPGSRFMQMAIGTLATMLLYLTLSIGLTFYQKMLIKDIKFPFTIVVYHLIIKLMLAACVRAVYKCRKGKTRVKLDWRTAVRSMAPTGIASGIDIGFSNWGLELVPISLYTMTKSSTIVFILFFAILLGLEKKSWLLVFTVGLIAIGLFMFTYKSTQFDALGFTFILVASLSSGIRWSFAQFVMQKTKLGLHNPIDMIYHMQPWMIASLLPFLITIEGQKLYDVLRVLSDTPSDAIIMVMLKVTAGAVLAFFMEVSEFMVLSQTSSLTLSIAGIFKDICQLVLAVEINNDQLSLVNVLGLIVCLAGICCHLVHKYSTLTKLEDINALDDDSHYHDTNVGTHAAGASNHSLDAASAPKTHSAQTVPLLEQTDSDDSNADGNEQNASDVIFDVLKRRDMQR